MLASIYQAIPLGFLKLTHFGCRYRYCRVQLASRFGSKGPRHWTSLLGHVLGPTNIRHLFRRVPFFLRSIDFGNRFRHRPMLNNPNFKYDVDEAAVFVLSAWRELFDGFTPDSNQPRLHNVISLVDELVTVSELWANSPYLKVHAEKIQQELAKLIDAERDILDHLPGFRSRCKCLTKAKTSGAIISGGKILLEQRDEYWNCFATLARAAIAGLPQEKENAFLFIRRLATFAFQNGKEDDDVWRPFEDSSHATVIELFDQMIQVTKESAQDYIVLLAVIGNPPGMNSIARLRGFEVVSPKILPDDFLKTVGTSNEKTLYIQQVIQAVSIRRAVSEARKNIGVDSGLVSLYKNPDDGIRIHPAALVSMNRRARTFIQSEQAFRRLRPRRDATNRIKEASGLIQNSSETDPRLLAAVEQLALASASSDSRTRYVNLWAALETLAGVHEGATTISKVCGMVVPLIISRHVHRTTRYLTILLDKYKQNEGVTHFGPAFPKLKGKVSQEKLLLVLASPKDDPKIDGLLTAIKHPLLRWKIFQSWKLFHEPKKLEKSLRESHERLDWHLCRIYRARNMLVHEGVESPSIVLLLDNLQNYLSTLVQRLIHELQLRPDWSIRQVVEHWHGRMNHIFFELRNSNFPLLMTNDFLEEITRPQRIWVEAEQHQITTQKDNKLKN